MCFDIKFLKCWLKLSTIVTILGGIAVVIYSCLLNKNIGEVFKNFQSSKDAVIIGMIIFGVFISIIGLIGLIGASVFVILALFFIIGFSEFKTQINNTLTCQTDDFKDLDKTIRDISSDYFCSKLCPCKTNPNTYPQNQWNPIYKKADPINGHINLFSCNFSKDNPNYNWNGDLQIMQFLEKNLNCAGLCYHVPFKSFTEISMNYQNLQPCGPALATFLENEAKYIGIFSAIIAAFMIISSIFSFCLCCHPNRKKKIQDFYQHLDK